jgi:hypothetical protein
VAIGAIELPPPLPPPHAATDITQTTQTNLPLIARSNLMANLLEGKEGLLCCEYRAIAQWFIAPSQSSGRSGFRCAVGIECEEVFGGQRRPLDSELCGRDGRPDDPAGHVRAMVAIDLGP